MCVSDYSGLGARVVLSGHKKTFHKQSVRLKTFLSLELPGPYGVLWLDRALDTFAKGYHSQIQYNVAFPSAQMNSA